MGFGWFAWGVCAAGHAAAGTPLDSGFRRNDVAFAGMTWFCNGLASGGAGRASRE